MLTTIKHGIVDTRKKIISMLEKSPDCQLIVMMCWLEIHLKNAQGAWEWINKAEQVNYDRPELLYPVRLFLSGVTDKAIIIEEILSRNDLPLDITQNALFEKAKLHLSAQQWEEADKVAKRIFFVEDWPVANWIRWVIKTAQNNEEDAKIEFEKIKKELPHGHTSSLKALGSLYVNDLEKASEALFEAVRSRHNIEYISKDLVEFSETAEFKSYCERMTG